MYSQGASFFENIVRSEFRVADAAANFWYNLFVVGVKAYTERTTGPDEADRQVANLKSEIAINLANPLNYFWFNPEARRTAFETNGKSVIAGVANFVKDQQDNYGNPALTDRSKFEVGRNLGMTPGVIVLQTELFELIRYTPVTQLVHQVPLLFVPPWINKFHILDLAPGRSLVEKAVAEGQTVYLMSWVNPGKELANTQFYDYITKGTLVAMDFIGEPVNLLGLCLGGTIATMTTALDAATKANRVNSLSLIVTLTDFGQDTGVMGAMINRKMVEDIYQKTKQVGFLTGQEMGSGWVWISSEGLWCAPARKRWLLGEEAPAMDLLAWNADTTRLPALMHYQYLLACYIDNLFAKGEMVINGYRLSLGDIHVPVYAVAGSTDHIVPWKSSFRSISRTSGQCRLVLVPRGHIGVIVAPASPKASYMVEDGTYTESWEETATNVKGDSWWSDWTNWLGENSGPLGQPPVGGPNLGAAPGTYVLAP